MKIYSPAGRYVSQFLCKQFGGGIRKISTIPFHQECSNLFSCGVLQRPNFVTGSGPNPKRNPAAQHSLQANTEGYSGPGCAWAELSMRTRLCTVCKAYCVHLLLPAAVPPSRDIPRRPRSLPTPVSVPQLVSADPGLCASAGLCRPRSVCLSWSLSTPVSVPQLVSVDPGLCASAGLCRPLSLCLSRSLPTPVSVPQLVSADPGLSAVVLSCLSLSALVPAAAVVLCCCCSRSRPHREDSTDTTPSRCRTNCNVAVIVLTLCMLL